MWWIKYSAGGRVIRQSTGTTDKRVAKRLLDSRVTAARNLERAGVPRSVAMKITGHRTEAVYRRYTITSDADQRDAAVRLGTFLGTPQGVRLETRSAKA